LNKKNNILICPLEWGLGHAGRMVPLARKLQAMNNNIFIGSGEEHLSFFRNEIPGLTYIYFPGFRMRFSRHFPQYLIIILKIPDLIFHTFREHRRLKKIIKDYSIDIIISDSRIGLWNSGIKTVFVLHIPRIPFPEHLRFLEFIMLPLSRFVINKYSYCFIPDLDGDLNISGRLSHGFKIPPNLRYIGILSRFSEYGLSGNAGGENGDSTVILSGPEPQKGILKQKLIEILNAKKKPSVMLEGKPGEYPDVKIAGCVKLLSHLPDREMRDQICRSETIITRSGYSTIMELISLNRSALIIPTPGQTEQEYLAEYLSGKGWFRTVSQKKLDVTIDLPGSKASWPPELVTESAVLLDKALNELLNKGN
jgi:UDP-N-acetylglucosamine transferase subunit ALG13